MASVIENPTSKLKCQVFTPNNIVSKMLNCINYDVGLYGKRILDHSCGDGQFLKEIVRRYIIDCQKNFMSSEQIRVGLSKDIWGVELDTVHFNNCKRALDAIAKEQGILNVKWNIYNFDALRKPLNQQFDYIVENPPYLSYWDIPEDERIFIRDKYESCKKGAWDYCFAFIEEGLSLLKDTGVFVCIIPNSIFKTKAAHAIRTKILSSLKAIHDFRSSKIFDAVLTSSAIIIMDKQYKSDSFLYDNLVSKASLELTKSTMGDLWVFEKTSDNQIESHKRFGDYFKVSSSVATQYNKAFVLKNWTENGQILISTNGDKVEKAATKSAASPKGKMLNYCEHIIFPYHYVDGALCRYSEDKFCSLFPYAYEYLKTFKDELLQRDADKTAKWFEFGRSQALEHLEQPKILLSSIVTHGINLFELEKSEIPYSGIYIVPKKDLTINDAVQILTSTDFNKYVKAVGVDVNGKSLRITATNISDYLW